MKHWLRSNSQYNLPQVAWARLITQRWKKKINQDSLVRNQKFKSKRIHMKKINLIINKKENFFEDNLRTTHY